jgi:hypothetical protein
MATAPRADEADTISNFSAHGQFIAKSLVYAVPIKPWPVFLILLHYVDSKPVPQEMQQWNVHVAFALLMAAQVFDNLVG